MKFGKIHRVTVEQLSHPVRGAWIEISMISQSPVPSSQSHPVRGAWIEIIVNVIFNDPATVAPRQGCVD